MYINRYIIQHNGGGIKMGGPPPIFMDSIKLDDVSVYVKCMCFILIWVGMFHIFLNIFDIFICLICLLIYRYVY